MPRQDPVQSADEQRKLRGQIQTLNEEARRDRDLLVRPDGGELCNTLSKLEELSQQVRRPREQAEESDLFNYIVEQGAQMAKALGRSEQARTPGDFIRALLQAYGSGEEGGDLLANPDGFRWRDLSQSLVGTKRSAPGLSCLLGTLTVEAKRRKVTQRQPKQKLADVQAPSQRDQAADEEEECKDSAKTMEQVWEVLQQHTKVSLLQLVLSHASFAQTVENLFALSMLVRDAKVSLYQDPDGTMVELAQTGKEASRAADGAPRQSFVLGYSMADWEAWKSVVSLQDCLMPDRSGSNCSQEAQVEEQENRNPAPRRVSAK